MGLLLPDIFGLRSQNSPFNAVTMDLWRLLGYSKASFYSHKSPIVLQQKDGTKTNLVDICKSIAPPCWLNPFLFNGHLQTTWTVVKSTDAPVYYKRKIFDAECSAYRGTFAVDFVVPPYTETDPTLPPRTTHFSDEEMGKVRSDDGKPMLVTLHGLTGGSHEAYLRHLLHALYSEGWEACVVNARGCARSKITSEVFFNARATWDVRQLVKWLRKTFPNRPLFAIGYSLGGCILVNVRSITDSQAAPIHHLVGPSDPSSVCRSILGKKATGACWTLLLCAQIPGILM